MRLRTNLYLLEEYWESSTFLVQQLVAALEGVADVEGLRFSRT